MNYTILNAIDFTLLMWIDSTGYHLADYPTFLAAVTNAYLATYGTDTYLGSDSQDGQWVAILAKSFYDVGAHGQAVYNSFAPGGAQGVGLARLVKLNGVTKLVASNSTVDVVIVGQPGTNITNGIVQDTLNQQWNLPASVLIPSSGQITVTCTAQNQGAVAAAAGTVNQIYTPTRGWQSVTNVLQATSGAPIETDAALRIRRAASVADPSLTVFAATVGGVQNLPGVSKIRGYENPLRTTDANGIPPNSVSIVVSGGDALAVAQEIAIHKTPGITTYGTTSQVVTDSRGMPLTINFFRPTPVEIQVSITINVLAGWSAAYIASIQQAVAAQVVSAQIGDLIYLSNLYGPAYLPGQTGGGTFKVANIQIQQAGAQVPGGASNFQLAFNQIAVCNPTTDVTVTIQ